MAQITLDLAQFRERFPAFANSTVYPDAKVEAFWDTATLYISAQNYGDLRGDARQQALNALTAHLLALSDIAARGQVPGVVTASTIDKISVSLSVMPARNAWAWWFSLTAYGQQCLALLQSRSVGGMYLGGSLTRAAFRGPGGGFGAR